MPEMYLHIGTHKTGTTSVQRFFAQNRERVREHGIFYPSTSIGPFPDHYAHHRVSHAIAGRDPDHGIDDARAFFAAVAEQRREGERVFISAEPMYRHTMSDIDDADRGFEAYAEQVAACVADFDVTVLVMLRRQDLFLESLYAEHVLSTGYTGTIDDFADERARLLDYESRLRIWAHAFGDDRLDVRLFEPKQFGMPIEQLFVEWLGADWSDSFEIGARRNVTLQRVLVEFKRMLNSPDQGSKINTQYRRWLEKLAQTQAAKDFPDLGKYYLQPRDRVELVERHEKGNRIVAERYLARGRLFEEPIADQLADYVDRPVLSDEDFRKISRILVRMIAND